MSLSQTQQATDALYARKRYHKYERQVKIDRNGMAVLYIFGYPIAAVTKDDRLFIKKPGIIDSSIVIRQFADVIQRGTDLRYWYWRDDIAGTRVGSEWLEIIDAGTVKMFNKQNPFKLHEH